MAAGSKGVGAASSLPTQQAAADPFTQAYCPDPDQWPRGWSWEAGDIPPGEQIVHCFEPFLRHLLSLRLSRKTLRQHRDNIWVLGGEIISRLQMDLQPSAAADKAGHTRPRQRRRGAAALPWPDQKPSNGPSTQPVASSIAS